MGFNSGFKGLTYRSFCLEVRFYVKVVKLSTLLTRLGFQHISTAGWCKAAVLKGPIKSARDRIGIASVVTLCYGHQICTCLDVLVLLAQYLAVFTLSSDGICFCTDEFKTNNFFSGVVLCILILSKFIFLPTDAQENCSKRSIKIYMQTAPTCFSVNTIIRERTIWAC